MNAPAPRGQPAKPATRRVLKFGDSERHAFRELVRCAAADEERDASLAISLAREWLGHLPGCLTPELLRSTLLYKVIGYNGDLHSHVIRARRAIAAADQFLGDAREVDFQLQDILLGEYHLLCRLLARGGRVTNDWSRDDIAARLTLPGGTSHRGLGFNPLEINFTFDPAREVGVEPADVLFVASMPNYLNPMIPVLGHLAARGLRVAVLAPRSVLDRVPAGARVRALALEDLPTREDADTLARATSDSTAAWREIERRGRCQFELDGVNLWPVLARDLRHVTFDLIPFATMVHALASRVVRESGVRALVVARLRRATELAFAHAAGEEGRRVVMVPHGHISNSPRLRFDAGGFELCDAVCAWSEAQARTIRSLAPEVVPVITGNPQWDEVARRGQQGADHRGQVRAKCASFLCLDPDTIWCVWASQDLSRDAFQAVAQGVLSNASTSLIVKVHPSEDPGWYRARVSAQVAARVRVIQTELPLHDILEAADIVLTFHSTTNVEALLLGTPVVTVATGSLASTDRILRLEELGQVVVTDESQLTQSLHALLDRVRTESGALRAEALSAGHAVVAHAPTLPSATQRVASAIVPGLDHAM